MTEKLTRLPLFAVRAMFQHYRQVAESRDPDAVIGGHDNPYLRRWYLTPRGDGPAVYLHQFVRSDDARALHDHPWPSVGLILRGSYIEHTPRERFVRVPGDLIERDPEDAHRVELLSFAQNTKVSPVWTLFIVGPRVREWGFHCPQGWRHWREFTSGPNGETVGRGCD